MWKIFGSNNSPYSLKVLSYARWVGVPHEWLIKCNRTNAEFTKHEGLAQCEEPGDTGSGPAEDCQPASWGVTS